MLRLALLALLLLPVRAAFADADGEDEPSYGRQTAIADLVPLGIVSAGLVLPAKPCLEASLASYLIGGPIVHIAHRHYGRASASVGLRIGFPVLGLLLGDAIHQGLNPGDPHVWQAFDGPPSPWWVLGGIAGFVGGSVVDATVLAGGYEKKPQRTWTPTARATHDGVAVGIAGAF